MSDDYIDINRQAWNRKLESHLESEFYNLKDFMAGATSLNEIELGLLGDINAKSLLHLQCHFGQDTLSLARMGAKTTGVDLSDAAIAAAQNLNEKLGLNSRFIACDLYSLEEHLDEQFDRVFTSYGTIGWLPDVDRWARIVARYLKPGGEFIFAEFHPVVWMFDSQFQKIEYPYFNRERIEETVSGTYADKEANIEYKTISWNHNLAEVMTALIKAGLKLEVFQEFDYSPYACFANLVEVEKGKFQIKGLEGKMPMVYALKLSKA